ncbi:hypothetical protein RHGRI_026132 [Rhododendron griersonianum]|uniref:Uncharacterized protein n=1 Tax=Rhododendron griersonianum TaxID=479676 RepID=A0AAV6IRI5_9ERIC|nr:hypothetical protein RHGRI_026132 [Rhododendron griersonianum]
MDASQHGLRAPAMLTSQDADTSSSVGICERVEYRWKNCVFLLVIGVKSIKYFLIHGPMKKSRTVAHRWISLLVMILSLRQRPFIHYLLFPNFMSSLKSFSIGGAMKITHDGSVLDELRDGFVWINSMEAGNGMHAIVISRVQTDCVDEMILFSPAVMEGCLLAEGADGSSNV